MRSNYIRAIQKREVFAGGREKTRYYAISFAPESGLLRAIVRNDRFSRKCGGFKKMLYQIIRYNLKPLKFLNFQLNIWSSSLLSFCIIYSRFYYLITYVLFIGFYLVIIST